MTRYGTYSTSEAIRAGLDLEMPGAARWRAQNLVNAVLLGKVSEAVLDERLRNILNLVNFADKSGIPERAQERELNRPEDRTLLRRAAAESIVLMKNDGNILPFHKDKPIAIIGPNSKAAAFCGGGSAALLPYYVATPFDGICAKTNAEVLYSQGIYAHKELPLLGLLLRTPDGKHGFLFRVYDKPSSEMDRKLVDESHAVCSAGFLIDYVNPNLKSQKFYVDMEGEFTPGEDGIYDFGVTVLGTGRLLINGELVVDNSKNQRPGLSFFGFGTTEARGSKRLKAGMSYRVLFEFGSTPPSDLKKYEAITLLGPGGFRFGGCKRLNPKESIARAVEVASKTEQVVIFAGLNGEWETEGCDRDNMDLPPGSDELISRVLAVNRNAVVVIQSGTPVTMPWVNEVKALAQAWYGGNETGNGIADVLYGDVNPSGKLPLSFPICLKDNPSYLNFGSEKGRVLYGEDVYVGYRFYEKTKTPVLFPFGHGLSYTTFSRSALTLTSSPEGSSLHDGEVITASLTATNTGSVAGAETIQLWVSPPVKSSVNRPVRELKGFKKVFLRPGEKTRVKITVEKKLATSFWDETREAWASESGEYVASITGTGDGTLETSFHVERTRFWRGL
jgi:beta-glucosidase